MSESMQNIESATQRAKTVVSCPFDSMNPYHTLYYKALERYGYRLVRLNGERSYRIPPMRTQNILHLHWGLQNFCQGRNFLTSVKLCLLLTFDLIRLRLRGIRIVWTCHNLTPHRQGYRICDWYARFVIAQLAHLVLTHGRAIKMAVRRRYFRARNTHVVPIGSNMAVYRTPEPKTEARRRFNIDPDARMFLFIGAMRANKGVPDLIRAFRRMAGEGDRLWIVGRVEDDSLPPLLDEAEKDPRVHIVRQNCTDDEFVSYLAATDVLALPMREVTTSSSCLLGVPYNIPTVVPRQGFFCEMLGSDYPWLFAPGNMRSLANALRCAADADPAEVARYHARINLSWDKGGEATAAAFDTLFPGKRKVAAPLKRMLLVSGGLPPMGGAEKRVTHLAAALQAIGIDTTLLVADPIQRPNQYLDVLDSAGVRVISASQWVAKAARLLAPVFIPILLLTRAYLRRRFARPAQNGQFDSAEKALSWLLVRMTQKRLFGRIVEFAIRRYRPQVVHVFKPNQPAAAAVQACKKRGIPVVFSDTGEALPHMSDYTPEVLDAGRSADTILYTCRTVAENGRKLYRRPHTVRVFPPLVPEPAQAVCPSMNGKLTLGYAGRITDEKNLYSLIAALGLLRGKRDTWRLLIAGDGKDVPRCRALAEELRIQDRMEWLGAYAGEEGLRRFAEKIHLYVLPSKSEGFPVSLVEISAMGRAMLATPVGGVPELAREGETGFLARDASPEALAEALDRAFAAPENMITMGFNARRLYEREFSPGAVLGGMIEMYRQLARGQA